MLSYWGELYLNIVGSIAGKNTLHRIVKGLNLKRCYKIRQKKYLMQLLCVMPADGLETTHEVNKGWRL